MKKAWPFLAMLLSVWGCASQRQHPQTDGVVVSVSVSQSQNTELASSAAKTIRLEDGPVIGSVKSIFRTDSVFYIHHGQIMSRYDMQGRFLGNISHQGRGPGEYLTLWYCWERDQSVFLYDLDGKKILTYPHDSGTLSERTIDDQGKRFQAIIPFGKGYVGKMGYDGTEECRELGFFDENYLFIKPVGSMTLRSGLWLGNSFAGLGENEVLYWRQLENDIYTIRPDSTISIKYTIDFVDRNVPKRDFVDEYEKIDFINSDPNAYATFLSNVSETAENLLFTFIFQAQKHLAVFDKTTRQTRIYHFVLPENQTLHDIFPTREDIFIVATNTTSPNSILVYTLDL